MHELPKYRCSAVHDVPDVPLQPQLEEDFMWESGRVRFSSEERLWTETFRNFLADSEIDIDACREPPSNRKVKAKPHYAKHIIMWWGLFSI